MTNDYIAYVRLNPDLRSDLDAITADLPGNQSDHIRQAIKEYAARILPTLPTTTAHTADITLREPA